MSSRRYNAPDPRSPEDRVKAELREANANNTLAAIANPNDRRGDRFALRVTEDVSGIVADRVKDAVKLEDQLSQEKREFLLKPEFKAQHERSIGILTSRNLLKSVPTENVPDDEQSLALLAELDEAVEIDLYKMMKLDEQGYKFELVVSPEELTPEEMQALKERKNAAGEPVNDFVCWDPSHPILHGGKAPEAGKARRFRVDLIAAGKDDKIPYLPSKPDDSSSDHYNNGTNYDSSRVKLKRDKMGYAQPSAYYVLATGKLKDREAIDVEGVAVLDMGERHNNPLFPVGDTDGAKVLLDRLYSGNQDGNLRVRPAGGGVYVPKEKV